MVACFNTCYVTHSSATIYFTIGGDYFKLIIMKQPKLPPPEWAEMQDLHHLFGVRKPLAYMNLGLIKTVIVKVDGNAKRGKRLVELASVRKLLEASAGNSPAPGGRNPYGRKGAPIAA